MGKLMLIVVMAGLIHYEVRGGVGQYAMVGKVVDQVGDPVVGAQVTVVAAGGAGGQKAITGEDGGFSIVLGAGSYTLKVAANGFLEASREVEFGQGGDKPIQFVLQVAAYRETVTVAEFIGYQVAAVSSSTRTPTPLRDLPQSITVVTKEQMRDQQMASLGDVVRYVPGIIAHQGENNRDQIIIRGNNSSADFFLNGVRDDAQYYRDLYNLEQVEVLRGPNAMTFGRGGGGGVINRVTKDAGFMPLREIRLQGGSFGNRRVTGDFGGPVSKRLAYRINGVYENSDSFRRFVSSERYGVAPTVTITPDNKTRITLSYERFSDRRTADRGITSFQGRPADLDIATFIGNPDDSRVEADVNLGTAGFERQMGRLNIRHRTQVGDYGRFYQNYVPGAVNGDRTLINVSAYNNATHRRNLFSQTDATLVARTGRIRHTLLGGAEFGLQQTDNFRNTGFFNNSSVTIQAPYANPLINTPVTFRQSDTDANNYIRTKVGAGYLQDQMEISRTVQVLAGVRFDRFDLRYRNNRNGQTLNRVDDLVSPRLGLILKPLPQLSVYGSYSVSYLPSSGDQFSSLTTITEQVKPEKFSNYEAGVKWDLRANLSLTAAVYRLNRTNTRSTDPNDPVRIIQTGSSRTNGYEISLSGNLTREWNVAAGYAYQDAFISSATISARAGARVGQVPRHNFTFWNTRRISRRLGAGFGVIHRSDMFAAVDNTVTLPGYTRADAVIFYSITERLRLQANFENLLDGRFYLNADNNTNISPGAPRTLRVGFTARF
jgi:catecholate siderophore receptor